MLTVVMIAGNTVEGLLYPGSVQSSSGRCYPDNTCTLTYWTGVFSHALSATILAFDLVCSSVEAYSHRHVQMFVVCLSVT